MRPVRLELKGFTAYREPQVLELAHLELFAITGPTGSGKSSLLDAMTYALYGAVPRVGNRASQLIAQGLPRLSVMLEFEVDGSLYRVTRTTGHKAQQNTIRLERLAPDGEWESYGEGADRIREANELIRGLVGLDYPAFTRSVVLPQGEFAEFLKGDAHKRREILTELLGLELFERMARRASEEDRSARDRAAAKLESAAQYEVDATAVKAAKKAAKEAKASSDRMAEVGKILDGIAKRWREESVRATTLEEFAEEANELSSRATRIADQLQGLCTERAEGDRMVAQAQAEADQARQAAQAAAAALMEAEDRFGTLEHLAGLRATLSELGRVQGRAASAQDALATAEARSEASQRAVAKSVLSLEKARPAMEAAQAATAAAQEDYDRLHVKDMVGALTQDLHAGDACPVCGRRLETIPMADAKAFAKAGRALQRAKDAETKAAGALRTAELDLTRAERDAEAAVGDVERCRLDLSACMEERQALVETSTERFGGRLPDDPLAALESRSGQLRTLDEAAHGTAGRAAEAEQAAGKARELVLSSSVRIGELVATLRSLPFAPLIERARPLFPEVETPLALLGAIPSDPEEALVAARDWTDGGDQLSEALSKAAGSARAGMQTLLEEAREALPTSVPMALVVDVDDLLGTVRTLTLELVAETAERKKDAERLAKDLATRTELEKEVAALSAKARVYHALALELRADRLLSYLQQEALELLALAGSERLLALSQGRYRLAFADDEFFVEDRQNGDERRSVKTLSGGETFLASLALALALSEQIQDLAVTRRARLESLFIDEGFGALDPEALEVATEALEALGGDGRMVCVITHVKELAEQMPVRIEVEKLPTGSRLKTVS